MAVITDITKLSQTASLNGPDGSVDPPNTLDDQMRYLGAFIAQIRDGVGLSYPPLVPSGTVSMFAGANAPAGYLMCNGAAVSRTTYATLFAAIGTAWGVGDGSTTFNVPDMRGQFPRGLDAGRGVDVDRVLGTNQASANLAHNHAITDPKHGHATSEAAHVHGVADGTHTHGGTTDGAGYHDHARGCMNVNNNVGFVSGQSYVNVGQVDGMHGGYRTDATGTHSHNLSVYGAYANISLYGATTGLSVTTAATGITINNTGGTESRPTNNALNFIIRT